MAVSDHSEISFSIRQETLPCNFFGPYLPNFSASCKQFLLLGLPLNSYCVFNYMNVFITRFYSLFPFYIIVL